MAQYATPCRRQGYAPSVARSYEEGEGESPRACLDGSHERVSNFLVSLHGRLVT